MGFVFLASGLKLELRTIYLSIMLVDPHISVTFTITCNISVVFFFSNIRYQMYFFFP
jgi:hypothetical protein